MILDINGYFGNWPYWPIRTRTKHDLIQLLDKHGIDRVAICSTRAIFVDWERGNEEIVESVGENGERLIGFATVSPLFGEDAVGKLAEYKKRGMRGLRLFPLYHGYKLDSDPILDSIFEEALRLRMPIVISKRLMMNWMLPTIELSPISLIAQRFPGLRLIISGMNYGGVREALRIMEEWDNISVETSCLQFMGALEMLVDAVGAERVLFGTGLPIQYPACGLAKVTSAQISERDKKLILGGNAVKLLGL